MSRSLALLIVLMLSGCIGSTSPDESDQCSNCHEPSITASSSATPTEPPRTSSENVTRIFGSDCDEVLFRIDADRELLEDALPDNYRMAAEPLPLELYLRILECSMAFDNQDVVEEVGIFFLSVLVKPPAERFAETNHYLLELGTTSDELATVLSPFEFRGVATELIHIGKGDDTETLVQGEEVDYRATGASPEGPTYQHQQSLRLHHESGGGNWTGIDLRLNYEFPRINVMGYQFESSRGMVAELSNEDTLQQVAGGRLTTAKIDIEIVRD